VVYLGVCYLVSGSFSLIFLLLILIGFHYGQITHSAWFLVLLFVVVCFLSCICSNGKRKKSLLHFVGESDQWVLLFDVFVQFFCIPTNFLLDVLTIVEKVILKSSTKIVPLPISLFNSTNLCFTLQDYCLLQTHLGLGCRFYHYIML
jgi:hypothetical protein